MWSNVISIDKLYSKEIDYIFEKLKNLKCVSYATEESKDRIFIYLAALCEKQAEAEDGVFSIMETVFLTFLKQRFFLANLSNIQLNHANCALICSLVHFDREYERNTLIRIINESADINVDGLMNFRLKQLTDNWEELAEVANRLSDGQGEENDVFDVATFITGSEGSACQLALYRDRLYNITDRRTVDVINLFDADEYNLISAIIKERPSEIIVENPSLSSSMNSALKHIARVIVR